MVIAQINGTFGHGDSTGGTTKEMHDWLIRNGHDSVVFARVANNLCENDKKVFFYSKRAEEKIHSILSRLTGLQGYYSKKGTNRIINKLREKKPDVVILRVLHNNSIYLPGLFNFLTSQRIPVVLVLHDCWYYTGHCCYYVQYNCFDWKNGCCKCKHIHDWNPSWIFDTANKCLKDKKNWFGEYDLLGVVGVSDWVTKDAACSILAGSFFINRIYNWIDFNVFFPHDSEEKVRQRHNIGSDKKIVFAVSTEWPINKGLLEIIAANKIENTVVIVAGKIEKNKAMGMICLGSINDPNVLAEYYSAADLFLNPSRYETFGKTTAEALSCGTPVVAYDTSGSRELDSE